MGMYDILVKPFVRKMDLDKASRIALNYFRLSGRIPFGRSLRRWIHSNKHKGFQREEFGMQFFNPIGLGAGLDLHGELYNDLNNLGFSFVEIGPMGADGVRKAIQHVQEDPQNDILAVCINKDYLTAFELAYDFFDFFVIDIKTDPESHIIDTVIEARTDEAEYKPVVIKIQETMSKSEMDVLLDYCLMNGVDAIESQNLTQVRYIQEYSKGRLPVIVNSHIDSPEQAAEALDAGASLIEVRTGLVREGPGFVKKILKYLEHRNDRNEKRAGAEQDRVDA